MQAFLAREVATKRTQPDSSTELDRLLAERSLIEFIRQAWPIVESAPFIDNWHISAICEHLEAVTRGQIPKLLINVPPGCSKSLLTSVFWPMWEWTTNPSIRWFFASYDQRLSTRDSVKCRALLESHWYQSLWGNLYRLTDDQNQKTYYETDKGGWRLATSVGGHGTGQHPDRIVVDDPHNVRTAESVAERQAVLDWWDLTMPTRGVSRNARRVIIMQRLHQEDLAGHVLEQGGWEHICLCMRHERGRMKATSLGWVDPRKVDGELLSSRQFSETQVTEMEKSLGGYGAAGQLQQRPVPREGGMFKREWLEIVGAAPVGDRVHRVRSWDKAGTTDGGDWTAGVLMARTREGVCFVEDVIRGQWSAGERNAIIRQTAATDKAQYGRVEIWLEREGGSGGKESGEISVKELAGYVAKTEHVTGSKEMRAEPFAIQCEAGNVRLVQGPWNAAYIAELCDFPNGKHDDQVDASSGAFNKLTLNPVRRLWSA